MAAYQTKIIPLDVTFDRLRLTENGIQIPDVTVTRLPAAAEDTVKLHVGEGGDPIDLIKGMALHITPPERSGLFISSTAALAGQSVRLLLGFVAGSSTAA